jgi:hypothetical protein
MATNSSLLSSTFSMKPRLALKVPNVRAGVLWAGVS